MRRLAAVFALTLATSSAAAAASPGFTFRDAEFMPPDRALPLAHAFVAQRFPPGLPMAEALARARAAELDCRASGDGRSALCRYSVIVHEDGGLLGDDTWRLRLPDDGRGALAQATLDYQRDSDAVE